MSDEKLAYSALKKKFPMAHWQRFETWAGVGVFDANGCLNGVESWVECKQVSQPKTPRGRIKPKVRPGQVAWEFLRRRAGGRTFIALLVGSDLVLLKGMYLANLKKGVTQTWIRENALRLEVLFDPSFFPSTT